MVTRAEACRWRARCEAFSSLALSARTGYTATHNGCDCLVTLIPVRCLAMAISSSPPRAYVDYPSEDGQPMAESDFQREPLTYAVEALGAYFQQRAEVYVSGNMFIYYEEGNPEAVVAPDVFVVFGTAKRERSSYFLWQEPKGPDFVLEITSSRTRSQDQGPKRGTYAFLGVPEYLQYDPTGDYLRPPLQGLRLVGDHYESLPT